MTPAIARAIRDDYYLPHKEREHARLWLKQRELFGGLKEAPRVERLAPVREPLTYTIGEVFRRS